MGTSAGLDASVLVFLAGVALHLKHLHDGGESWPSLLLLLVPIVGLIWAMVDSRFLDGEAGPKDTEYCRLEAETRAIREAGGSRGAILHW